MLENSIVGYGRQVAGMVSAACGQRPLYRVPLVDLVSLSRLNARKASIAYLRQRIALVWGYRRDLVGRSIPLEGGDRWRQALAEYMWIEDGAVDRDLKGVEKGMNWRVGSDAGSRDAAVDEQRLRIANVADAVGQGLAGQEADDAGSQGRTN